MFMSTNVAMRNPQKKNYDRELASRASQPVHVVLLVVHLLVGHIVETYETVPRVRITI